MIFDLLPLKAAGGEPKRSPRQVVKVEFPDFTSTGDPGDRRQNAIAGTLAEGRRWRFPKGGAFAIAIAPVQFLRAALVTASAGLAPKTYRYVSKRESDKAVRERLRELRMSADGFSAQALACE